MPWIKGYTKKSKDSTVIATPIGKRVIAVSVEVL
jgi:hypothetical protein